MREKRRGMIKTQIRESRNEGGRGGGTKERKRGMGGMRGRGRRED